jgi:amino acid transporter/nucleotide-binding universal stress UspA family protein
MNTHSSRPRELRWYHAAGIMFGDWGTSRLYVLGLAFALSGASSFWYVAAMCGLVTLVGLSYTVVCRHFPDGGGVYSSAKAHSRALAVVGALLLFADYIVTAALSAYEGFRYLGGSSHWALYLAVLSILAIGALNYFGLRRPGALALVIALGSAAMYLVLGVFCAKSVGHAEIHAPTEGLGTIWSHFANVILALSGVEAIANMTGVMAEPVARNARRAILTVMVEVVLLNLVMAYAMSALPQGHAGLEHTIQGYSADDSRDNMVKILAVEYVGPWFALGASILFGILLLSAANTAIGGMVSTLYLMSRDRELPAAFTRLNRFGMPWVSLAVATAVTALVLLVVGSQTVLLASLYAIGVVGAIAINLLSCGTNSALELKRRERWLLLGVGALMFGIEMTVAVDKPKALLFAALVVGGGLLLRWAARRVAVPVPEIAGVPGGAAVLAHPPVGPGPRVLVPWRGSPKLLKFATAYAHDKKATLFVLFVREVALAFHERGAALETETMNLAKDREAQRLFAEAREQCAAAGVPMVPLYAVHGSPAELILDHAATLGADALIMGASRRGALWKALRGDLLREVIEYLPERIPLLIYS